MRLVYAIQNGAPDMSGQSGPKRHVSAVVNGLAQRGHTVRLIGRDNSRTFWVDDLASIEEGYGVVRQYQHHAPSTGERLIRRGQRTLRLPYAHFFESQRFAQAIIDLEPKCELILERYDWMGYGGLLASRKLGCPLVLEINGNVFKEYERLGMHLSRPQRWLSFMLFVRTLREASHVVSVSRALASQVRELTSIPEERISVIENGASIERFRHARSRSVVRHELGLADECVICFVGTFQPWHGIDLLLRAFAALIERAPLVRLLLIGDGDERASLQLLANSLGLGSRTQFLGWQGEVEVASLLKASDIAVAPFPYRDAGIVGSPLKLYEYMAAGLPVVASSASIHDTIEDEATGIRVAPANQDALAEGLLRLVLNEDLRRRIGNSARIRAEKKHGWDRTVERLESLCLEVIQTRRLGAKTVGSV